MPLPNWASLPEIFRSVSTLTNVRSPSGRRWAVTSADAVPAERASRPFASITPRYAASSFSTNRAVPANSETTGPTLTRTRPW
ncbi:hypothetical protein PSN01_01541 [Micromonospora saelicesensis]|nr:hypothetical protein PSN01_01541 [Micromonospora saelicesensis]